ncbi:MAG: phage portal protein [Bacteroidales bacterium]|jgi:HK97 family phage portal protein|nr:phage portal protein [Bacteroidales bacterium]
MAKFKDKWFGRDKDKKSPTLDLNKAYLGGVKSTIDYIGNLWKDGQRVTKGSTISSEQAYKSIAVCRCIHLIASKVANCELREYRIQAGKETPINGDIDGLLNITPDEVMTSYRMWYFTVVDALLHGVGYIEIQRDEGSTPKILDFHRNDVVTPLVDGRQRVKAYSILNGPEYIPAYNMIEIRNIQKNGWEGVGALETLGTEINISVEGKELINNYFTGGLKVEGFFTSKSDMHTKQIEDLQKHIKDLNEKEGENIPFLPFGVSYEAKQSSPEDAKVTQTIKDVSEQICSFFGVPLSYIVQVDSTKIGSLEDRNSEFINDTVFPFLDQIERETRFKLYTRLNRNKRKLKYVRFPLFRMDFTTIKEFVAVMVEKGIFSINDALIMIGKDPIGEDGDMRTKQLNSIDLDIFKEYSAIMLKNAEMKQDNKQEAFKDPDESKDNQLIKK